MDISYPTIEELKKELQEISGAEVGTNLRLFLEKVLDRMADLEDEIYEIGIQVKRY